MGGFLGKLSHASPRSAYPLGFRAATMTGERLVLVGDSAHGIHPIAGQGVIWAIATSPRWSRCWSRASAPGMDLGDAALLQRYQQWRGLDTLMVSVATDSFNRIFGVPGKTASAVRRLGITAINHIPPLKNRFMAEARGETGQLPRLLQGRDGVTDQERCDAARDHPCLRYEDALRAIEFLCTSLRLYAAGGLCGSDDPTIIHHAQLVWQDRMVMVSSALFTPHAAVAGSKRRPRRAG
jgi:hypothetical protein